MITEALRSQLLQEKKNQSFLIIVRRHSAASELRHAQTGSVLKNDCLVILHRKFFDDLLRLQARHTRSFFSYSLETRRNLQGPAGAVKITCHDSSWPSVAPPKTTRRPSTLCARGSLLSSHNLAERIRCLILIRKQAETSR